MNVVEIKSIKKDVTDNISCSMTEVKRIASDSDYSEIFEEYIFKNVPFILPIAHYDWKCFRDWIVNGKPNFKLLREEFGSAAVPVANCGIKYFNAQEKENMPFREFLDYWEEYIKSSYPDSMKCLYLKDWHFTRDYPDEVVYIVPKYFSSDWLNEYLTCKDDLSKDDYRFVYMGPKGSWTPFHADVFSSFSWSANICGKKRWRLFPPGEENYLRDRFGNLVYDVESEDLKNDVLYPEYNHTVRFCELIQKPGEAIFIPSGWHHQVWNLDDTISINHNWINGCNISVMWKSLQQNLFSVKKEIADCQSMDGWLNHCQIMMKASFGIDYQEFYDFIKFIADKRMSLINNNKKLVLYGGWELGFFHAVFDLSKIKEILCDIILNDDMKHLSSFQGDFDKIQLLIENINSIVFHSC
ncbi:jumonji domain containing 4 [Lycorma delicatula]|uniref:jumonji domain containing 4 n=1 Tax=Lycorma delicatula TaxID=130591 RepID=UPI003F516FE0